MKILTSDCNVIQDVTRIKEVVQYLSSIQRKHTQILGKMILFYKEILFTCNSSVLTLKQGKNTRVKNKKCVNSLLQFYCYAPEVAELLD